MIRRLTMRARLTLVYTALFTGVGCFMLGVTYVLVERQLPPTGSFVAKLSTEAPPAGIAGGFTNALTGDQVAVQYLSEQVDDIRSDTLTALLTQGGMALAVTVAIAAGFSWLIAGQTLQPLHRITETAARITGSGGQGLRERIALSGPQDEVKRLADTFDQMLVRLDHSFDGQRRFVANASHELRTPLALNRALIELAITRPDASADARQLGDSLLKVNERHERLIDGLLTLADSETELMDHSRLDLADIAEHVLDQLHAGQLRITRVLDPAVCTGDPVLLERLIQNLLENAIKHNVEGGWVKVETSTVDGRARCVVTNTGPVVPTYELETIFQPFRRLDRERVGSISSRGLGLGLSIVRAITDAHGGKVYAASRPSGGLVLTVIL